MTAREWMEKNHPEYVDPHHAGGVCCCPDDYDLAPMPEYCIGNDRITACKRCWDRDIVDAENTKEVKETTDMLETFDYETEYEKLLVIVDGQNTKIEELTKENVALTANRAKLQDDVRYWMDKAERYELIVKAVEALVGRNIISEDDGYDD